MRRTLMPRWYCGALLAIAGWLAPVHAHALRFNLEAVEATTSPASELDVVGRGPIEAGDLERLRGAMRAVPRQMRVRFLTLDSPGGLVREGVNLATEIHRLGIAVAIPAHAKCASACFLLFAASPRRVAGGGAQIGVHSASREGRETDESLAVTTVMARLADSYGVPPSVLGKMVRTGPNRMDWLTRADLDSMDVLPMPTMSPAPAVPTIAGGAGFARPSQPVAPPTGQAFVSPAAPTTRFNGSEFRGVYFCRGGPASLVLRLETASGPTRALFSFGPTDANPSVPSGSFTVEGRYDAAAGRIDLRPADARAAGGADTAYVAGLAGESNDGGRTFSGRVTTNINCTRFSLRRVG